MTIKKIAEFSKSFYFLSIVLGISTFVTFYFFLQTFNAGVNNSFTVHENRSIKLYLPVLSMMFVEKELKSLAGGVEVGKMDLSSQITFLYFDKYDEACEFFDNVLKLERVFDPGPACVWRTGRDSFIGAVDSNKGSLKVKKRGGVLISLTVKNIDEVYRELKKHKLESITEIGDVEWAGLKSFFFKGPEGYDFEIQQFVRNDLKKIF